MKVAIVGFGLEGRVSYEYWSKPGNTVVIHDANRNVAVPVGAKVKLGPDYLDDLAGYDVIVRSPGVRLPGAAPESHVTSATREFFRHCPVPIIGVTGTKGKGTTSTLVTKILEASGKKVWLGGNIGRPVLEFLDQIQPQDMVVLELSSFQLFDLDVSPHIAVCLMIVPEHLDWHQDFDEYVVAKGAIARYQQATDMIVYHGHNPQSRQIADLSSGHKVPYLRSPGARVEDEAIVIEGQTICRTDEVGLLGAYNLENVCAAVTATWDLIGKRPEVVAEVLRTFKGLPLRLQLLGEVKGVLYVNDSYSVNQYSTIGAMKSFQQPEVVIVGGYDRGIDLTPLVEAIVQQQPRQVLTVGQTGPMIHRMLNDAGYNQVIDGGDTMTSIVAAARSAARPGDAVLFSPGCASFDMFKNFEDRGRQFTAAVTALE